MPNISIVVPEVQQSVLRPIVFEIVRQLESITKISKESLIFFPGEVNRSYQPGSGIKEAKLDGTQFYAEDLVQIEIEEDYRKDSVLSTATTREEQLPVFCDDKLGVMIKPIYVTTEVTINFKFKSKNKTTVTRWRDDMRMRTSMARDINLHQITYSYMLPDAVVVILQEIHRLRESVEPYGEDIVSYVVNNASTRLTELSNLSGETRELAIAETQMRIVGYFDFEGYPDKPEKEEDTDSWVGSFAYKLTYEKPISCNMSYPVMIHNQILSNKYRPDPKDTYDLDNHLPSYSLSINAFNYFEAQNQIEKYVNTKANIVIPDYDEFIPHDVIRGTVSIFSALCQLSLMDKKTLINLKELGEIAVDPDIIDFIQKSEYPFIGKLYQSIIQVSIYRSMTCASQELVNVKSNLDVCSVEDLDIRVNHRIRFSIVTDLNLLNPAALNRLKRFPLALVKIIKSINEGLRNNPGFNDLGKKKYIDKDDIYRYILKPDANSIRINPDFSCIMIKKQPRNDSYILDLLEKLIVSEILLNEAITVAQLNNYIQVLNKVLLETKVVYATLKDSNYTDLLMVMLTQKVRIQEQGAKLLMQNESPSIYKKLMTVFYDINKIIDELKLSNDGISVSSDNCSNIKNTQTVMSTSIIARDGIRGASISDYKRA